MRSPSFAAAASTLSVAAESGWRPNGLSLAERVFWKETLFFQPLSDDAIDAGRGRLGLGPPQSVAPIAAAASRSACIARSPHSRAGPHSDGLGSGGRAGTVECAAHPLLITDTSRPGWRWSPPVCLGLVSASRLHGSDLLHRADLLATKLRACRFCVTVSDFNRDFILRNYPSIPAEKIIVQRLGVDRVIPGQADSSTNEVTVVRSVCSRSGGCTASRIMASSSELARRSANRGLISFAGSSVKGRSEPLSNAKSESCGFGIRSHGRSRSPRGSGRILPPRRSGRHDQQKRGNPRRSDGGHVARKARACPRHHRYSGTG